MAERDSPETILPRLAGGSTVTVGSFDGVHLGHQAVLREIAGRAAAAGRASVLVTFEPHPLEVVNPRAAPPLLTTGPERREVLAQTPLDYADPIVARHDTEAIAEGREELRQVIANLDKLSEDRREALIMRFALGMDNREIARALGRTDGATKVLIHRAIRQLEEIVKQDEGPDA